MNKKLSANDEIIKKIKNMKQSAYEEWIADTIVKVATEDVDEIVFNLNDKNRLSLISFIVTLNSKIKASGKKLPLLKIAKDVIDSSGGFILRGKNTEIDCSLETLLNGNNEELKADILKSFLD